MISRMEDGSITLPAASSSKFTTSRKTHGLNCLLIIQVARGSGAAAAGLRGMTQTEMGDFELGDIIVGIDSDKVTNSDDLFRVLDRHQIGETVQVHLWRDGRRMSAPVRLTESPDSRR